MEVAEAGRCLHVSVQDMPGWGDDINLVRYLRVVVDFILQARQKVRNCYFCCYFVMHIICGLLDMPGWGDDINLVSGLLLYCYVCCYFVRPVICVIPWKSAYQDALLLA
jgi:hypothetical protein